METNIFVKLGGSFITDKSVPETLIGERVVSAAKMIREALERAAAEGRKISLVLGHGAGSFGHIHAVKYKAVWGVHPELGWEGLYKIRESMTRMNRLFLDGCAEGGLYPVTISPFAVALAKDGALVRIDVQNLFELLSRGQIPLIHGDVVPDSERGFTIASTETLLAGIAAVVRFDRAVMVSDTDGVLGEGGATIGEIPAADLDAAAGHVGGSGAPDVTGGMRSKLDGLFSLIKEGRIGEARIIRCGDRPENLRDAMLGTGGGGTLLKK